MPTSHYVKYFWGCAYDILEEINELGFTSYRQLLDCSSILIEWMIWMRHNPETLELHLIDRDHPNTATEIGPFIKLLIPVSPSITGGSTYNDEEAEMLRQEFLDKYDLLSVTAELNPIDEENTITFQFKDGKNRTFILNSFESGDQYTSLTVGEEIS